MSWQMIGSHQTKRRVSFAPLRAEGFAAEGVVTERVDRVELRRFAIVQRIVDRVRAAMTTTRDNVI